MNFTDKLYEISLAIFNVIPFLICYCFFTYPNLSNQTIFFTIHILTKVPKLFFGIATIEKSSERRKAMYDLWIEEIEKQGHIYAYCTKYPIEPMYNWVPVTNYDDPSVYYSPREKPDVDRQNKRVTLAQYFLSNTNADFLIDTIDDAIVDSSRINELASILQQKYNTDEDLVMLGNCRVGNPTYPYLQGGTGYIMTRKMAFAFVNHSKRWIRETRGPDDVTLTKLLGYMGKHPSEGAIPYMAGHGFSNIFDSNFSKCPDYYDSVCKQGVYRLNDVYIIHPYVSLANVMKFMNTFHKLINEKKQSYGFYHVVLRTTLCKL